MDLSVTYRSIVRRQFPKARILADGFHVIRLVNHHFLNSQKMLDTAGAKNRGLLWLMSRHRHNLAPEKSAKLALYLKARPAMEPIYQFKQKLCYLLLEKHQNHSRCRELAPKLLRLIAELQTGSLRAAGATGPAARLTSLLHLKLVD